MNKTKKNFWIRTIAVSLAMVLLASTLLFIPSQVEAADTSSLGALLDSFSLNGSTFTLSTGSRFFIVAQEQPSAELIQTVQLAQKQFAGDGYPSTNVMPIVWGEESLALTGDIVIKSSSSVASEGYQLDITDKAVVTASDTNGLLYGLNMLQKHFRLADEMTIKGFTAADAPDTAERTVSLDFARKYYSKNWICNFIKEMSWMGYNTIQLHLAEDSGMRMDIWDEEYYTGSFQPSNDFSWICGSRHAFYLYLITPGGTETGTLPTDVDAGKYLTTAEMIEILNTAKEYHIEVIPSFDSPGHNDYLTWMYEYNYKQNNSYSFYSNYYNKTYKASEINGIINYANTSIESYKDSSGNYKSHGSFKAVNINTNEQARALMFELHKDIATFFKEYAGSTEFSICADELNFGYGDQITYESFVKYINDLNTYLNGMNYTCRAYNDFIGHTTYSSSYPLSAFPSNLKIMYWSSDFNAYYATTTKSEDVYYFDGDRPLYNCLGNSTYYAQSYSSKATSHPDSRCPDNTYWTMNRGTEDHIYNNWAPNNFTAYGKYNQSSQIVPTANVTGAYFLIWSDNCTLSTEAEIWNGFYSCDNDHLYVSLFDRMLSNAIKMWNWDINSTVTFANFTTVRDDIKSADDTSIHGCPGFTGCSTAADLPAATEPTQVVTKAALSTAMGTKLAQGIYSDSSYAAYTAAYDAAQALVDSSESESASLQTQRTAALNALQTAQASLAVRSFTITYQAKAMVDGAEVLLGDAKTFTTPEGDNSYNIFVPALEGYVYVSCEGLSFTPGDDDSGYITGTATENISGILWYRPLADATRLNNLILNAVTDADLFTADSWAKYQEALENAEALVVTRDTTQEEVDALADALENAQNGLVYISSENTSIEVELLGDSFPYGKQIGLRVITNAEVTKLTIKNLSGSTAKILTPDFISSEVQTLSDGTTTKIWLILLPADEVGTFIYSVSYGIISENFTVVIS